MRKTSLNEVYKLAQKDKRVVFVGSDLGHGTLDNFKREFPDRFFMEGVSEQHLIGMLSGLALSGKIPYFNTIAVFEYRRCLEQVIVDIALPNLPVRLIGSGGGLVYTPLGPTHLAIDDIAIFRTIPNMTIVAPADAEEMKRLMPQTLNYPGPIYIRLAKGDDPIVTPSDKPFKIGKGIVVQEGSELLLVTTGITLQIAKESAQLLKKYHISPTILHMPTIKPFDGDLLIKHSKKKKAVIIIEEGRVSGGMGSEVLEVLSEANSLGSLLVHRIGIPDVFPEKYGSQMKLMDYYGISSVEVVASARKMLRL